MLYFRLLQNQGGRKWVQIFHYMIHLLYICINFIVLQYQLLTQCFEQKQVRKRIDLVLQGNIVLVLHKLSQVLVHHQKSLFISSYLLTKDYFQYVLQQIQMIQCCDALFMIIPFMLMIFHGTNYSYLVISSYMF